MKVAGKCPCCGKEVVVEYKHKKWGDERSRVVITHKKWQEGYR